jgi:ABC-type glycerol-3-phosphate transport system permease component
MSRTATLHLVRDGLTVVVTFAILCLLAFPFVWVVLTSLKPDAELFSRTFQLISAHLTLDNYRVLFERSNFQTYIRNSLVVCLSATLLSVSVALLAAYAFSRRRFPGRQLLLLMVVATQLFPFVVLITPLYALFYRLGLVNTYAGLIIAYVAITLPFSIYLLLGYLDTIPRELDEAGIVDGCSTLGVLGRVVLPVAWPGVVVAATYAFISAWDELLIALTLMTQEEVKTVPVGMAGLIGEFASEWNLMMAASTIAAVPTLILFLALQRRLVSELAAGSVKQ